MLKKITAISLILISLLSLLASCGNSEITDKSTSSPEDKATLAPEETEGGEPVETSPDGGLEWTVLGYEESKSFAGRTAAEGKTIIALYLKK